MARAGSPEIPSALQHIEALRFGRTIRGRTLFLVAALILEAVILSTAAQQGDADHFRGVPGVSAVFVACALAALAGPVAGGIVAAGSAVVFLGAVAGGTTGSWLVVLLWPAVAILAGMLTDRLLAADAEQARLVARLVESERRQLATQIVGGIGHHFNNQLTVMMGYAELAQLRLADGDDPGTVEAIDALHRAGERLSAITRLLFILSGGETDVPASRDVSAAVRALEGPLAEAIAPRRLEFRLTGEPAPVLLEDRALDVLLTELVRNAAEATPPDATIRVATSRSGEDVVLEVADSGRGMSESELLHAFEPFFSTKPPVSSTGLGLPVARALAERAGGDVTLASRPGAGTTVSVRLPVAAPADGGTGLTGGVAAPVR